MQNRPNKSKPGEKKINYRGGSYLFYLLAENVSDVIWITELDDPEHVLYVSPSITRLLGYNVAEAMAKTMAQIFTTDSYEYAWNVLREEMVRMKSGEIPQNYSRVLEIELLRKDGSRVPVEIKYSLIPPVDKKPARLLAVARDITDRKRAEYEFKQSVEKMHKALQGTVNAIAKMVEMRDPYTAGHQQRVAKLSMAIAKEMKFNTDQIRCIGIAAVLHDIGKIYIPAEILGRTGKLTDIEYQIVKTHVTGSYEILKNIEFPWPIAQIVLQHHERIDGSGYPDGLKGNQIFLEAKILAVSDTIEAMITHRPYRTALRIDVALEEIYKNKGKLYDKEVVDACFRLFMSRGFSFMHEK